ncbi:iron-sulfur cluster assembly protein [Sphingobacterium wenxiniae]|uniref:Iron-sulfur cluster assembly protein n=2 Tax=Sphingobacterium wenxiniae TaxID=683125 RepID=A0A1I6NWX9_9SPHI|nr:iron-sulfur cluster assembly protein [Sphingobacterium wenxiniae]
MDAMVTITDKAKGRIEQIMREENYDSSYFVRVAVESGGCSGLSYKLDFDNEEKKGDQFCEDKGIRICLDIKSYLYLAGTELDYSDGLNGKGFEFHNPNASRTCACGESFSV